MTLRISDFKNRPALARVVSEEWQQKNDARVQLHSHWDDIRRYVYANDTRFTTAASTPWKNQSTRNKLARIRDMLVTTYVRNLIPTEDFFRWQRDASITKANQKFPDDMITRIQEYQLYKNRSRHIRFRETIIALLNDWVIFGNTFAGVDFVQKFKTDPEGQSKLTFQGARPLRYTPHNVAIDSEAMSYADSCVIHREVISRASFFTNLKDYYDEEALEKLRDMNKPGPELQDWIKKQHQNHDGINWFEHFDRDEIELIEYFGSIYDPDTDTYFDNQHIVIADKFVVLVLRPNVTNSGEKPIFHSGWRLRPDNLWGQGPLDNILGLQYRIDHVENLKADSTDFMAMPVIVTSGDGIQEQFKWEPGAQWNVPTNASVEILYPDPKIPLWNDEIITYERTMEELAGVPRETAGFRTPGEKTAFEVDQLMGNADGFFEDKLMAFEQDVLEPLLNQMLEVNLNTLTSEEIAAVFPEEILAPSEEVVEQLKEALNEGRFYVTGSKHYKARQRKVQEIQNLLQIGLASEQTIPHVSIFAALKALEKEIGIEEEGIISFGAAIEESAGLQMKQQEVEQQMAQLQQTQPEQVQGGAV